MNIAADENNIWIAEKTIPVNPEVALNHFLNCTGCNKKPTDGFYARKSLNFP